MFVSNALLSPSADNFLTQKLSHQKRITWHWILQIFGLVTVMSGASAIYINKDLRGAEHFQSLHSTFGLISYATMFAVMTGGILANLSETFKKFIPPAQIKGGHTILGAFAYSFFIFTLCSGIYFYWDAPGVEKVKIVLFATLAVTTWFIASRSFKKGLAKLSAKSSTGKSEKPRKVK